jgi:ABC-type antimicrobial peptide transport system permease subunit
VAKEEPIPVIIDKNTAMYSLHLYQGIGEVFPVKYEDGTELQFKVVGLLSNSILQGSLIVGERDFVQRFPEISGYRYFLVGAPPDKLPQVKNALSEELSDQGFDPQSTHELLADLLQVQNTYLSTFQSLGALGLLLGTFGLATVQLRSVLERRRELALLRAEGFARSRIARLVLIECLLLLAGGLATGTTAALLAVLPHMLFGGASLRLGGLALMLGIVFVAGVLASLVAVRATLKADIIAALRGE